MKLSVVVVVVIAIVSFTDASANGGTCVAHLTSTCNDLGSEWTTSPLCSSIHGGFRGNANTLQKLMTNHLSDSFRLLSISSQFNTDKSNRMGFHKFFRGHSDKMWQNGKKLLKYIVERGGRIGQSIEEFRITDSDVHGFQGEVSAFAVTLDLLKQNSEDVAKVIEAAQHKKKRTDDSIAVETFDPAISHFLKENLVESYTEDIRQVSGHLNVLASILKNDKSADLGIILYNKALEN